jgi:DNA-binding CsgD family transcriptional regulator
VNVISITYLVSALLSFESAVTVLRLNRCARTNITYAVFTFSFTVFCFMFSQFVIAPDRDCAFILTRLIIIPGCFLPPTIAHFSLFLTGNGRLASRPWFIVLLYVSAVFFCIRMLQGHIITDIILTKWGWVMVFGESHQWSLLYIIHNSCIILASALLILYKNAVTTHGIKRKQYRMIILCCLLASATGIPIIIFLLSTNPDILIFLTHIIYVLFFSGFIIGVRYSIKKYRLMSINPECPAAELITGMREPVFLTTAEGEILCKSPEAELFIRQADAGAIKTIFNIFTCEEALHKEIEDLASGKHNSSIACSLKKNAGPLLVFALHLQGVRNEEEQLIGIIITAQEDPALMEFRDRYRITERQLEIIFLAVSGLTNHEMAARLNLAERTVENHLCNIYNKLGVNNKIELYGTAARYNLKPN